jgi:hypothetical protein
LLLLELLRDELELDVVGRDRDFVEEEERLTLERERVELELDVELERLIRDLSAERLTLERERVELDVELLYFERESLLVPDENDRFEDGVERL